MDNTINTNSYINNYTNYCTYRLPCGVCQRTNSMCPLSGGAYTPTWTTPTFTTSTGTPTTLQQGETTCTTGAVGTDDYNEATCTAGKFEKLCSVGL